jgi:osmoprotectant transport system ATP-binding protein
VALVGPSGCGKTTTLRMINRLIEPTGGTIEVGGVNVRTLATHELRRGIGYVIQQAGLFPHRSIADNIATVPKLLGWDRDRIRARVAELVDLVGLDPELLGRYPAALSGGQQQRVGVARALAADPPILLMDEPYSAVDPIVRERLQDELLALQRRLRKTVVFVTHDIDEAIKLADRIAILDVGGVLEQYGPPSELLRAPANRFVESFLGRERALRRMALLTVAGAHPRRGPVVDARAQTAEVREVMRAHHSDWVGVLDGDRLLGWVDDTALDGFATVGDASPRRFAAWVHPDTGLREALDTIVLSATRVAVVLGDDDRYLGMVTIDDIAKAMEL